MAVLKIRYVFTILFKNTNIFKLKRLPKTPILPKSIIKVNNCYFILLQKLEIMMFFEAWRNESEWVERKKLSYNLGCGWFWKVTTVFVKLPYPFKQNFNIPRCLSIFAKGMIPSEFYTILQRGRGFIDIQEVDLRSLGWAKWRGKSFILYCILFACVNNYIVIFSEILLKLLIMLLILILIYFCLGWIAIWKCRNVVTQTYLKLKVQSILFHCTIPAKVLKLIEGLRCDS